MLKPSTISQKIKNSLSQFELPTLGREVKLPVYVIHNSPDPEDYFFIFDFEQFVEQTRQGAFVRPTLTVWAGRSDFGRTHFARQFRESFGHEFDIARAQLSAQGQARKGWFGFLAGTFSEIRGATLSAFLANLVLLAATTAGTKILSQVIPTQWFTGKSKETQLEDNILATQGKVDAALVNLEIRLHEELYDFAFRHGERGKRADLERDAWPLPSYVRTHLSDGKSGAWW